MRITKTRRKQKTLLMVFSENKKKLDAHLLTFEKASEGSDGASTAAASSARVREIEQAPPCASYKKLIPLIEIEQWHTKFEATSTPDDLTEVKMEYVDAKKPILDLIAACKTAVAEVELAKADFAKLGESPKGKGKGKKKGRENVSPGSALFKHAGSSPQDFTAIPVAAEGAVATRDPQQFNASKPMIITLGEESKAKFLESEVTSQSTTMVDNWMIARKGGRILPRAARKMKQSEGGLDLLPDSVWQNFFPPDYMLKEDSLALPDLFVPAHFVIEAKHLDAAAERENLAAVRVSTNGSRQVVLARFQHVRQFLQAELVKKGQPATELQNPATVWTRLKVMSPADVTEFKNMRGELCFGTIAPWQALYVPATYICVDHVLHETVVGVGRRVVLQDAVGAEDLAQYNLQLKDTTTVDLTGSHKLEDLMKQTKPAESAMPISEEQGSPSKAAKTTHAAAEEEAPPNKAAKTTDADAEDKPDE